VNNFLRNTLIAAVASTFEIMLYEIAEFRENPSCRNTKAHWQQKNALRATIL
jgi:hypothetical protein